VAPAAFEISDAVAPYRSEKPNQDQRFEMSAAARQRLHRTRESSGRVVLGIEVDEAALCAALVAGGFISPNCADDRKKLEAALSKLVEVILTADLSRVTASDWHIE
jgi:hypothetical protein